LVMPLGQFIDVFIELLSEATEVPEDIIAGFCFDFSFGETGTFTITTIDAEKSSKEFPINNIDAFADFAISQYS